LQPFLCVELSANLWHWKLHTLVNANLWHWKLHTLVNAGGDGDGGGARGGGEGDGPTAASVAARAVLFC
jgi:hypothetical protein